MPATIACPHCRTTHMYPDQMVGKRARCKQCLSLFLVSALTGVGTPVDDVDPHEQVQKETTKAKAKPAPPRRRHGDDYGPEPARKSGGSGTLIGLLVGCGAFLVVLVLGAGGVAAWFFLSSPDQPSAAAPPPKQAQPAPPPVRPPDPFPPVQPKQPAQPQPPVQPKQPQPPAKPAFTLSNAKVTRLRNVPTVHVEYRPDAAPPAADQQFFLLIRSAGGGTYRSQQLLAGRLSRPGALNVRLPRAMNDPGPFELTLRMGRLGMADEGESVSNTVSTGL
ncbi:MAG TPA: hypothetical protein VFE78_12660 [Gemmataceae bacterium]|nr:hypothetical protein [Gemmataceae bacterium]